MPDRDVTVGFRDVAVFGDVVIVGSVRSDNWDGGDDLTGGVDAGATEGFLIDAVEGAIQAETLYAVAGSLGSLSVTGTLTLSGSGKLVTAGSGRRVEIVTSSGDNQILLYSGDAGETPGAIYPAGTSGGDNPLALYFRSPVDATYSNLALIALHGGATTGSIRLQGHVWPRSNNAYDLGVGSLSWRNLYCYAIYDESNNLIMDTSAGGAAGLSDYTATTYTPALTAATTNPGLGDGADAVAAGWYRKIGKQITGEAFFRFDDGATPATAGSGTYRVSLPVTSIAYGYSVALGDGIARQGSTGYRWHLAAYYAATTYLNMAWDAQVGAGVVTHAVPFTWDDTDTLTVRFSYTAA